MLQVLLLKTTPVKIKLKADAVPYAVTTARRVSIPLLSKVKAELDRMVKCGVIEEITAQTECTCEREWYILPTLNDILPQLSGATMFTLLDAES